MPPPDDSPSAPSPPHDAAADYWELDAELRPEDEELWGAFCYEHGALGAEVLDDGGPRLRVRYFFAHVPTGLPDVPIAGEDWAAAFAAAFSATYPGARAPLGVTVRRQGAQPWEQAWREHFTPLRLGRRLLVVPPWDVPREEGGGPGDADRVRIVIDPGQGFGTGWHPSTALALLMLEDMLEAEARAGRAPPRRVLDVGCGSGILAIAARLLGVEQAVALDVDAAALPEVRRNFALSGLTPPPALVQGRPDGFRGCVPLVLANIVAEVLHAHREHLCALTAPGGCLILSGILVQERDALTQAYAATGLHTEHEQAREGWVALRLRRR